MSGGRLPAGTGSLPPSEPATNGPCGGSRWIGAVSAQRSQCTDGQEETSMAGYAMGAGYVSEKLIAARWSYRSFASVSESVARGQRIAEKRSLSLMKT